MLKKIIKICKPKITKTPKELEPTYKISKEDTKDILKITKTLIIDANKFLDKLRKAGY